MECADLKDKVVLDIGAGTGKNETTNFNLFY
jgi:predicted RNA methylase